MKNKTHLLVGTALAGLSFSSASASTSLTKVQTLAPFAGNVEFKHKAEAVRMLDGVITKAQQEIGGKPTQAQSAAMNTLKKMRNDVIAVTDTGEGSEQSDTSHATNGAGAAIERGGRHTHHQPAE